MLLEEITRNNNTWSPSRVYSLLHLIRFNLFLPDIKFQLNGTSNDNSESFATLVLFTIWSIMFLCYKKLLNSILRRMQIPFIQRNRIVEGSWYCGFSGCSMLFLAYFATESPDRSCPWCETSNLQLLGFSIHETFYLHRATLETFVHNFWLKGWTIGLFISGIFTPLQQKWPAALTTLLFYEATDAALLNSCKILLTLYRNKIVKRVAKLLFLLHFINWIYIHILLVPGSLILLYADANSNWNTHACLWMWLVCELLNSVRNKEFDCMYSDQCLETCLFPAQNRETIEFVNILKKRRNSVKNTKVADKASKTHKQNKTELWQTLLCAMTIKKKLKKLGERKRRVTGEESTNPE